MAFPVVPNVPYRYRNNFLEGRVGVWRSYNHLLAVSASGTRRRAHDGVDIYMPLGTPLRAPFDGIVIDPATHWKPWDPARYGIVVVVVSTEATSRGYAALLVHLGKAEVTPGQRVRRGQRVGVLGRSGNADNPGILPHLHFELRSPFLFAVREAGRLRQVDAFDPYPSLRAADPRARR